MTSAPPSLAPLREWIATATLEELVTSPDFFGLTTASPIQRAFCRAAEGEDVGELAEHAEVRAAFGGTLPEAGARPFEMAWFAAIRAAKSLIAAAACVRWSQVADLSDLGPGEVARVPVLSLDKDKAKAVLDHLVGRVMASPLLRMLVVGRPNSDGLTLLHPSGRHVRAIVVAGKRAGSAVVSYWLAGAVFDEFPRMHGADDAVVNWDETRSGAMGRIRPGGQIFNIGSPWAPFGPAYAMHETHFGKPSANLVVMQSDGPSTNPKWWTPKRVAQAREKNPNFRMDVEAKFATPEEALLPVEHIERYTRAAPEKLPHVEGADYACAMDPATRGNGWTLVLARREGSRVRVVLAREWRGSRDAPLDPKQVLKEVAAELAPYHVTRIDTDQHLYDSLVSHAEEVGLTLILVAKTDAEKTKAYFDIRTRLASGGLELVPALKTDLMRLKKRVTQAGVTVVLPLTSDGRHCDYAPAVMLVCSRYLDDVPGEDDPNAALELERQRMLNAVERKWNPQREDDDE